MHSTWARLLRARLLGPGPPSSGAGKGPAECDPDEILPFVMTPISGTSSDLRPSLWLDTFVFCMPCYA